jgi:hypothetical protein
MFLFEFAVYIDEEERETRAEAGELTVDYFYHLIDECREAAEYSSQPYVEEPNVGQPSIEQLCPLLGLRKGLKKVQIRTSPPTVSVERFWTQPHRSQSSEGFKLRATYFREKNSI